MQDEEAKSVIEAILFMAGEPVTLDTIRKITEIDKYNTERLIRDLVSDYSVRNAGLFIVEVAEGYQMVTNPACAPWVKKLLSTSVPKKLSQSSLETMAIIAYKQPIIKAEIEAIRGVNSDGVVKTLLDKRLIKILGRKEVPGRPLMYGTTKEFLQYFGLKDLSELPTLKEFQEVDIPEPDERSSEAPELPEYAEEVHQSVAIPDEATTGQEPQECGVRSGDEQEDDYVQDKDTDNEQPSDEAVRSQ
ncbi:MAG: SMC-Scp complex subunit ScpB [Nitrospirae bacterium]|nr:SMC-Scp complex subunit ScpB [Nitrospirota bacterium]